jgi:hypothetical protein
LGQISELAVRWTAVASKMRPYHSDLGQNALQFLRKSLTLRKRRQ